jgi:LPS sulfotransferase NodH
MNNNKSGKKVAKRAYETISYLCDIAKSTTQDKVRLAIFGQGRSGSTVLESLICSTGHFRRNGELLNTGSIEILYPTHYIRGLSKLKSSGNFVFHVKIQQLTKERRNPVDPAEFLNTLYGEGWQVLYLRRRNKVRQVLSNIVAHRRGDYHKYNNEKEALRLVVDCDDFIRRVNERLQFQDLERKAMANIEYHEIIYEDDLEKPESHQETINGILDHVSLEHREVATKHKKVNTQSLQDLVVNYDDLVDRLTEHGFQNFL